MGRWVRLACERHLRDLDEGPKRGLIWRPNLARHVVDFYRLWLRLENGEPFILQPWQAFIVGSLIGWETVDGYRRFRTAYIEVAKGNGKSPLAAGLGLYGMVADGEPAAQIYAAAVTQDQAAIVWRDADGMVERSPELSARVQRLAHNLAVLSTGSFFRPISSERRGLDGKRVHMALIDEIHEHPSPIVVDKMRAGTKGRRRALIFEITNAGYDRESVCWRHHEYSTKILEGVMDNDAWFAYIAGLDPCEKCRASGKEFPTDGCPDCDDWKDPSVWIKANPNLGVSISERYLQEQVDEAVGMPAKAAIVKRLNFGIWTESVEHAIPMDQWHACDGLPDEAEYAGRPCYGGLDLASTTDIAALALVWPLDDGSHVVRWWFWVPEEMVRLRRERDNLPYDQWVAEGWLEATPGNVIDYEAIRARINELAGRYRIVEIGHDPWNATNLVTNLQQDGATMVAIPQTMSGLSGATKALLALVQSGKLRHGGNPVASWMASNMAVRQDGAGNMKPAKDRSKGKIDGMVAAVMALGRTMVHAGSEERSVYEERGLVVLE